MIEAAALIERFRYALDNAWGYIWGKAGTLWTEEKQRALMASYAASGRTELRYSAKYGDKWIGHYVADCSGLFRWAFLQLGGDIYHGSDTIWKRYLSVRGTLKNGLRSNGTAPRPGSAVFLLNKNTGKRSHIGLYCGDGICIEARGTKAGVVTSSLSHWDEWGELRGVHYDGDEEVIPMGTLRRGSRGDEVSELQEMLSTLGYDCGKTDGVYGEKTEAAVRAFQLEEELEVDGIAGPKTRTALQAAWDEMQTGGHPTAEEQAEELQEQLQPPEEPEETVTITLPKPLYRALAEAFETAAEADGR